MSKILELRDAIVSSMRALDDAGERFVGVTISAHGGEFDTKRELDAYAKRTPGIVISVQRVDMSTEGHEPRADCVLAAFILTADKAGNPRTEQAITLVDNVLDYLGRFPTKNFGVGAGPIRNAIARNLYHEAFDQRGIALWGIFWEQTVTLEPPVALDEPALTTVDVDYDLHPRDNDADLGAVVDAEDTVTP